MVIAAVSRHGSCGQQVTSVRGARHDPDHPLSPRRSSIARRHRHVVPLSSTKTSEDDRDRVSSTIRSSRSSRWSDRLDGDRAARPRHGATLTATPAPQPAGKLAKWRRGGRDLAAKRSSAAPSAGAAGRDRAATLRWSAGALPADDAGRDEEEPAASATGSPPSIAPSSRSRGRPSLPQAPPSQPSDAPL